jgi:hypothetical protein
MTKILGVGLRATQFVDSKGYLTRPWLANLQASLVLDPAGPNPIADLRLTLPVYANNAAALAGGLVAKQLYRTGGDPDLVCVVH